MTIAVDDNVTLEVVSREAAADGIVTIELSRAGGGPLPEWAPGAHIDVETQDESGKRVTRQYSLCGKVGSPIWRIAILADAAGRGGSRWLHRHAHPGTTLVGRGPGNHFALEATNAPVVLVAGGIGITPLMPMANALHQRGVPFRLHYHVRRRSAAAFLRELQSAPYARNVHLSVDEESPRPLQDIFAPEDAHGWVYTCGPGGFMQGVAASATAHGITPERIRKELFAAAPANAEDVDMGANKPFLVRIHSTGQEVQVPADQTAVQALAAAGIDVVVSCEQGYCGSCLTRVVQGLPDHRDQFMHPEEQERNNAFTPCCSRSLSPCLVLDL